MNNGYKIEATYQNAEVLLKENAEELMKLIRSRDILNVDDIFEIVVLGRHPNVFHRSQQGRWFHPGIA